MGGNRSLGDCSGRVCLVYKPSLSLSTLPSGSHEVSNLAQPHGHATMMPTVKVQFPTAELGWGWEGSAVSLLLSVTVTNSLINTESARI